MRFASSSVLRVALCGAMLLHCAPTREQASPVEILRSNAALSTAFASSPQTPFVTAEIETRLPRRAGEPVRVARRDDADAWIEIVSEGASKPLVVEGAWSSAYEIAPSTDTLLHVESGLFEEVRLLHAGAAPIWRERIRFGPALHSARIVEDRIELLDHAARPRFTSLPVFAVDATGTRRVPRLSIERDVGSGTHGGLEGVTLTIDLDMNGLVPPIAIDPAWVALATLLSPRADGVAAKPMATTFAIGAGSNASGALATTEFVTGGVASPGPALSAPHGAPAAFGGAGSALYVVGGIGGDGKPTRIAERVALVSGSLVFETIQSLAVARARAVGFQTTSSGGDRALMVAGGFDGTSVLSSCEVLVGPPAGPSATLPWTAGPPLNEPRADATLLTGQLESDPVLIAGGNGASGVLSSVERYSPSASAWGVMAPLKTARSGAQGVRLLDGKGKPTWAVFGGRGAAGPLSSAEIYDDDTKSWVALAPMSTARADFALAQVRLDGGELLLVAIGGTADGKSPLKSVELFSTRTRRWSPLPDLATARMRATVVGAGVGPAAERTLAIAGGFDGTSYLATVEKLELGAAAAKGSPCAQDFECSTGACADGVCCDAACDGQCLACDVKDLAGTCTAITGAPHGKRPRCMPSTGSCDKTVFTAAAACDSTGACKTGAAVSCHAYTCDASGCFTSCTSDTSCAPGYGCTAGTCQPRSARCSKDGLSSIDDADNVTSCAPYKCKSDGTCDHTCGTSSDCSPGTVCDATHCAPAPPSGAAGGCALGTTKSAASGCALLALVIAAFARRRA